MTEIASPARSSDQYDWLTALVRARQAQTVTCRMIAAIIVATGLLPTLLIPTLADPHRIAKVVVSVSITVGCAAMAMLWLRSQWPSRRQSQLCASVGTLCVATACLMQTQPLIGLLGCTASAILAAYTAFFHSLRLLAFIWIVAGLTVGVLAVHLAAASVSLAAAGTLVVVLINVAAVFVARSVIRLLDNDVPDADLTPLTGLLTTDGFYDDVATLMGARSRREDRYLAAVVIDIDNYSALMAMEGAAAGTQATVDTGDKLRRTVRREAVLAQAGQAQFWVADVFTAADPTALIDRIRSAIANRPSRVTASIGAVITPLRPLVAQPPRDVLDEVLGMATDGMQQARRAGGDQRRVVVNPTLVALDGSDED
jgi:GGDEF domain-containing protein